MFGPDVRTCSAFSCSRPAASPSTRCVPCQRREEIERELDELSRWAMAPGADRAFRLIDSPEFQRAKGLLAELEGIR